MDVLSIDVSLFKGLLDNIIERTLDFIPDYKIDKDEDSDDLLVDFGEDFINEKFVLEFGSPKEKYLLPLNILEKDFPVEDVKLKNDQVRIFLENNEKVNFI